MTNFFLTINCLINNLMKLIILNAVLIFKLQIPLLGK